MAFTHFSDISLPSFARELDLSFVNFYLGSGNGLSRTRYFHARLIFFFQAGESCFFDDGTTCHHLKGGDWVLIPPFVEVRHFLDRSAPHLSLHFTLLAYGGFDMLSNCQGILCGRSSGMVREIRREIRRNDKGALTLLFQEICWKCLRSVRREFPAFGRVPMLCGDSVSGRLFKLLIDNASPGLTMKKIAGTAGISRETFIKKIKEATGIPPGRIVDRVLVLRAIRLLTEERRSVKETAYELGFPDPYGFSRFFRRMTGSPPGQFGRRFQAVPPDAVQLFSFLWES